jgi:hypothetical protein
MHSSYDRGEPLGKKGLQRIDVLRRNNSTIKNDQARFMALCNCPQTMIERELWTFGPRVQCGISIRSWPTPNPSIIVQIAKARLITEQQRELSQIPKQVPFVIECELDSGTDMITCDQRALLSSDPLESVFVAKSAERFWTDQQTSLVLNDAREMQI